MEKSMGLEGHVRPVGMNLIGQGERQQRRRLCNETKCSSVFGLKVVTGRDSHLHSATGPRWISLILN